jgi:hypothetical protein
MTSALSRTEAYPAVVGSPRFSHYLRAPFATSSDPGERLQELRFGLAKGTDDPIQRLNGAADGGLVEMRHGDSVPSSAPHGQSGSHMRRSVTFRQSAEGAAAAAGGAPGGAAATAPGAPGGAPGGDALAATGARLAPNLESV